MRCHYYLPAADKVGYASLCEIEKVHSVGVSNFAGNAFRHAAAAALMVYYGYEPLQVASLGWLIEFFESNPITSKGGWYGDGVLDTANNTIGILYGLENRGGISYEDFFGGLAVRILNSL